jgi:hypothetical protein
MRTDAEARRSTLYAALRFCQLAAAPDMPEIAQGVDVDVMWHRRRHRRHHGESRRGSILAPVSRRGVRAVRESLATTQTDTRT